jgi:hypothetical protein
MRGNAAPKNIPKPVSDPMGLKGTYLRILSETISGPMILTSDQIKSKKFDNIKEATKRKNLLGEKWLTIK